MDESESCRKYPRTSFRPMFCLNGGRGQIPRHVNAPVPSSKLRLGRNFSPPLSKWCKLSPACLSSAPIHVRPPSTTPSKISQGGELPYPHQSIPSTSYCAKAYSSPLHPHPQAQATSIIKIVPQLGGLIH
jgi:hypothetical protein